MNSDIYRVLVAKLPILTLPTPLHRLRQRSARQGAVDAGQLLRELREMFPREELLAAGVVRPKEEGSEELILHPDLADPQRAFLPLFEKGQSSPFELVGQTGCISGDGLPLLAALKDGRVQTRLESGLPLLLTFGVADSAILSALRLPTTVATGLDRLAGAQLDAVCKTLEWRRGLSPDLRSAGARATDTSESSVPLTLDRIVLVGWTPSTWSSQTNAAFFATCKYLERLHDDLKIQLPQVMLWRPEPSSLESIAFVAANGKWIELRQSLLNSIRCEAYPLIMKPAKEESLATALEAMWDSASEQPRDSVKAQDALIQMFRKKVLLPLLKEAEGRPMPEQIRSLLQAMLSDAFNLKSFSQWVELARQTPAERSWNSAPGIGIDLKPMLQMARDLLKLLPAPSRRGRRR